MLVCGSLWQSVLVCGSLWQSVAVCGSFNFYRLIITTGLSPAGAKANCALHTILSKPSLESLEFLEILRLFFEETITVVYRSVGNATPPFVMVLFRLCEFIHITYEKTTEL